MGGHFQSIEKISFPQPRTRLLWLATRPAARNPNGSPGHGGRERQGGEKGGMDVETKGSIC